MTPRSPIEFVRALAGGLFQRAGNRVQIEDATAQPVTAANPLPVAPPSPLPISVPAEAYVAGHERLTLAAATAPLTVPAGATKALIVAEGGDVHYAPAGAASAVSPGYIPAGSAVKVPPPAAVYGAVGAFANVVYLA